MHELSSPFNINSTAPLNNPSECMARFIKAPHYHHFTYGIKWNLSNHEEIISKFYKDNSVPSFKKALYLTDAIKGTKEALSFISINGVFRSVLQKEIKDPDLLILLLKIFGEEEAWPEFGFVLDLICSNPAVTMPRGLGLPDLYCHASFNAHIVKFLSRYDKPIIEKRGFFTRNKQSTTNELKGLQDTIIFDLDSGSVVFKDCFRDVVELESKVTPTIMAIMRIRNESRIIKFALESIAPYVDHIIIFDDKSTDNTVDVINSCKDDGLPIDLILSDTWVFNESLIHQSLVSRGRELGGTHFIQIDADEILSDNITPQVLREIMSNMQPGDILALPWLNLTNDMEGYYSEELVVGLTPSRGLKRYKDIAFADDGFSQFPEWLYAHVNVAPFTYKRRFLSIEDNLSLYHLEQINNIDFAIKKDWYRARAFDQNKRLPSDPYLDIRLNLLQINDAVKPIESKPKSASKISELFDTLTHWRVETNIAACEKHPQIKEYMYVDYERINTSNTNNLSEKI